MMATHIHRKGKFQFSHSCTAQTKAAFPIFSIGIRSKKWKQHGSILQNQSLIHKIIQVEFNQLLDDNNRNRYIAVHRKEKFHYSQITVAQDKLKFHSPRPIWNQIEEMKTT